MPWIVSNASLLQCSTDFTIITTERTHVPRCPCSKKVTSWQKNWSLVVWAEVPVKLNCGQYIFDCVICWWFDFYVIYCQQLIARQNSILTPWESFLCQWPCLWFSFYRLDNTARSDPTWFHLKHGERICWWFSRYWIDVKVTCKSHRRGGRHHRTGRSW